MVSVQNISKAGIADQELWSKQQAEKLFDLPFNDLLFKAHTVHRESFDPNEVQ